MQKIGFAVFYLVAMLGAVLLLISQVPLKGEYYDVVETRSFSGGEPLTFLWTFEAYVKYRFVVKGADWTNQSSYVHWLMVQSSTYDYDPEGVLVENPWALDWSEPGATHTLNVTFQTSGRSGIDQAFTPTSVEISALKETTYHLTYLVYVGLPLLIIGAILIMITERDADSRLRTPDTSALNPFLSFSNTQVMTLLSRK